VLFVFEAITYELNGFEAKGLARTDLGDVTAGIGRVRGALDALEVRVAATVDDLDDNGGDVESMMRSQGHVSKREAARRARRAKRLKNMPNATKKLADGDITAEHADELAKAAEQTSETEVDSDQDLLSDAKTRPADMAQRDIRDWVRRHQSDADRADKHRCQRDRRSLVIFDGDDDMTIAHCRSDKISGAQLRGRIDTVAQQLHRQDTNPDNNGGGDQPAVRTWDQLRHDALMILTGIDTTTNGTGACSTNSSSGSSSTTNGTGPSNTGGDLDAEGEPSLDAIFKPGVSVRNQIVVVVDADVISSRNPNARCEIPGVGPIPTLVLERLACDADIFGHIFNGDGTSLWHSRSTRTVSPQQWRALVARDGGCVICAADPAYCQAHHIIAWAQHGPTNIENLALLCAKHHHQLHDLDQILIRDPNSWHTQPRTKPQPAAARAGPHPPRAGPHPPRAGPQPAAA